MSGQSLINTILQKKSDTNTLEDQRPCVGQRGREVACDWAVLKSYSLISENGIHPISQLKKYLQGKVKLSNTAEIGYISFCFQFPEGLLNNK